jgi:dethiobiotin synthetase
MSTEKIFVAGIGTDVGKTITSAILVEALHADYWKPIQTGMELDKQRISELVSHSVVIHPEAYHFSLPASPHTAAAAENINIISKNIKVPMTANKLVIEGAGGVMVPMNGDTLYIDWICENKLPTVVVSRHYLGSINHTLLTIMALQNRGIEIIGLIFNGDLNPSSEQIILKYTGLKTLLHIEQEAEWTTEIIKKYAKRLNLS